MTNKLDQINQVKLQSFKQFQNDLPEITVWASWRTMGHSFQANIEAAGVANDHTLESKSQEIGMENTEGYLCLCHFQEAHHTAEE